MLGSSVAPVRPASTAPLVVRAAKPRVPPRRVSGRVATGPPHARAAARAGSGAAIGGESLSVIAALLDAAGESRLGSPVLGRIATKLARALDASVLTIRLLDHSGRSLDLKACVGISKAMRDRIRRLPVNSPIGGVLVGRRHVLHSGGPIGVPGPWPASVRRRFQSAVFVPIRSDRTVVGSLGVGWTRGAPPRPARVRLVVALGRQLGVAIGVVRAREARRKLRSETQLLRKITAALSANLEQREILDMVTTAAWRLTRAAGAIVVLQSRDRSELEIASQSHAPRYRPRERLVGTRFPATGSLASRVVRSGRAFRVRDTSRDRRPMIRQLVQAADVRGLLMVPLGGSTRRAPGARAAIGVLAVSSPTPRTFSDHDRRILTQLGQQASIAIQNAQLFASVRNHRQLLRRLYSQQFATLEGERKRIAHELHDEMGPTLSATLINLQLLKDEVQSNGALPTRVADAERLLTGLIDKVRELAYGLHPPMLESVGLAESMQWMIDTYFTGGRLGIDYRFTGTVEDLNADLALALYRIAQEALTNIVKHADARRVRVRLRSTSSLVALHVHDDGCGFDVTKMERKPGFGLASMRERTQQLGGRMALRSAPGKGCRLTVSFPVEVHGARAVG